MMNRLLLTASRSAASSSLRGGNRAAAPPSSSAIRHLAVARRHLSDSAESAAPTADDDEIKVGTVHNFNFKSHYGFILPDGIDKEDHKKEDLVFIHRNDIRTTTFEDREGRAQKFYPGLKSNMRVQFKVKADADGGKKVNRAYDLTLEGGRMVPPFAPDYVEKYTISQKNLFGQEAYGIIETSGDGDPSEMEEKLVAAFEKAKGNIERQTIKFAKAKELMGPDATWERKERGTGEGEAKEEES
mmetsp:Transcript_181/g.415  ORF Transcript_181/g.415 Transcript_181/m.415 type:complete len:243 (+) Transcript_181:56-784(+)